MWIIRFALLGLLIAFLGVFGYFLSHRQKYQGLLENRAVNLVLVIVYNLSCFLIAGLPSDVSVISPPGFFVHPATRTGLFIMGLVVIGAAALVMGVSVRQRKTLGGENVKAGLLTSGVYRYFRHPIYVGIIGVSLGIALLVSSWDGLLMIPAVAAINVLQATIEERYDIGKRFVSQYQEYRKRTRLLGPIWMWAALVGCMVVVAIAAPWVAG